MTRTSLMKTFSLATLALAMLAVSAPLASAQTKPAQAKPAQPAQAAAPQPTAAELSAQLAEARENLARQMMTAENARKEVEKLRGELKLKDELLALGIQRNADLYAIAQEIADKGLPTGSMEVFVQNHRVQMENLRQDYEDKLRAARIYPETLPPSVQKQMDEELAKKKDPAAS